MKIKIIKADESNWYKVGEVYQVNLDNPYENIGCRVFRDGFDNTAKYPDVVMNGNYERM